MATLTFERDAPSSVGAMAAKEAVEELCEELTCPICLDCFRDPVSLPECGHNFCRRCLTRSWGEAAAEASCPQCRAVVRHRDLKPNRQLANIVEIAEKMSLQQGRSATEAKGAAREELREPSGAGMKKEAFKGYHQIEIFFCLDALERKKTHILEQQMDIAVKSQEILRQTEVGKEKTLTEFRKMYEFLKEQEELLLAQVNEVKKEVARENTKQMDRLSKELSSLESFILEVEKMMGKSSANYLQDIKSIMKRHGNNVFTSPVAFIPKLPWRIWEIYNGNHSLEVNLKLFQDTLTSQLQVQEAAKVILDPNTANPCLLLSKDQKSVRRGSEAQKLPKHPERFDHCSVVLGSEGFMEGCHFWEFSVGSENGWSVGVIKKSVNRKDRLNFRPEGGIWAMGRCGEGHFVYTHSKSPLCLSQELKSIRVCLNHPEGHVAFFDGDRNILLYEFTGASFRGETLFPFFQVFENGHICLTP